MNRSGLIVALLTTAWSALAFGAVYPWAYTPVAIGAVSVGLAGLFASGPCRRVASVSLMTCLAAIGLCVALQMVVMPTTWVLAVSPHALAVAADLWAGVRLHPPADWTVSVMPRATGVALLLFVPLGIFLLGLTRLLSQNRVLPFVRVIVALGTVVAAIAIVQMPLYRGRIYGFWTPENAGTVFGPFVNHNHFSGWMMMALPLAIGLSAAEYARVWSSRRGSTRDRLLWLGSPEAGRVLLPGAAAVVMALSLLLANSRSGIVGFMVSVVALLLAAFVRGRSGYARLAGVAIVAVACGAVGAIAGFERILSTFGAHSSLFADRWVLWQDAWKIVRDFPIVGTGVNTFGFVNQLYQRPGLEFAYYSTHNDYLQVLIEGGAVLTCLTIGAVLSLAALIARAWRTADESRGAHWIRAGAVAGLVAIGVQEAVDFSLQIPGNAVLFVVLCAIAAHRSTPLAGARTRRSS